MEHECAKPHKYRQKESESNIDSQLICFSRIAYLLHMPISQKSKARDRQHDGKRDVPYPFGTPEKASGTKASRHPPSPGKDPPNSAETPSEPAPR